MNPHPPPNLPLEGGGVHTEPAIPWLIALGGFTALYLPTYIWAARTIWRSDEHAHGAIVLAVAVWLFWRQRHAILAAAGQPARLGGGICFAFGLLLYIVGRSQDISIFEIGSQIAVLAGLLLLIGGRSALRAARFPLAYLIFMIPLPGPLVDAATGPLKHGISMLAENILHAAGYPIARSGVVLAIGQYRLLIADACSGLHSMFSLAALGVLFLHLRARGGAVHKFVMLASILPIAFAANAVRVIVLILVTYHLGDAAGQGFLHGAAGMVLFLAALLGLFLLDAMLARAGEAWRPMPPLALRERDDA